MGNNIILHDFVLLLGNNTTISSTKGDFVKLCNQKCHVLCRGGGGGHEILGVGHSVLCQMEEVGHVSSNHHIMKCPGPPPSPCTF